MKKILIIGIILFSLSLGKIFAQNLQLGIFVDPKISWMTPDSKAIEKGDSKFGVNIGLSIDNYFAPNYAFSTGISINNVGGSLTFDDKKYISIHSSTDSLQAGSTLEYNLQYINIPLGLKLKTNEIGYISFYTNLGLNAGINIKSTGTSESNSFDKENINDEINLFNLGYYIGGGIEYSLGGNSSITAGITYTNGFMDITKPDENKITLSNVALRVGVLF
ncbi:MAG: porin family protein [Bacteroidota bacterium]|nr:porin family protein [Bacteroidota bacterium]